MSSTVFVLDRDSDSGQGRDISPEMRRSDQLPLRDSKSHDFVKSLVEISSQTPLHAEETEHLGDFLKSNVISKDQSSSNYEHHNNLSAKISQMQHSEPDDDLKAKATSSLKVAAKGGVGGTREHQMNAGSPGVRRSNKIFDKLYNTGRQVSPLKQPRESKTFHKKKFSIKRYQETLNLTYTQSLQRNMFARQREETDRVYRKVLREERKRIIKSATRRDPKMIAAAAQRSRQALVKHDEWRSNQLVMRYGGSGGNLSYSPDRATSTTPSLQVVVNIDKEIQPPSGTSTRMRASQNKERSTSSIKSKRSVEMQRANTSELRFSDLQERDYISIDEQEQRPKVKQDVQINLRDGKVESLANVGVSSYNRKVSQKLRGVDQQVSARFPGTVKVAKEQKKLAKSIVSHGSVKPLHQSAFLLKKMRQQMHHRQRSSKQQVSTQELKHNGFIESYASHLRQSGSSRSLSQRSRKTRTSAEFGTSPNKISRQGTSQISRHDSKPQMMAFAQEVQEAIHENNCALTQKPSIEEPPSFREPINPRNQLRVQRPNRVRPTTSTGPGTRAQNRLQLLSNQKKNFQVMKNVLRNQSNHLVAPGMESLKQFNSSGQNPYTEETPFSNSGLSSTVNNMRLGPSIRGQNRTVSAKRLIKANQHPYQRPVSNIRRNILEGPVTGPRIVSTHTMSGLLNANNALRSQQRIKYYKGYSMTTQSFENINNAKFKSPVTAPNRSTNASAVTGSQAGGVPVQNYPVDYQKNQNWMDREPKLLEIDKSILAKKRHKTPLGVSQNRNDNADLQAALKDYKTAQAAADNRQERAKKVSMKERNAPSIKSNSTSRGNTQATYQIVQKRQYNKAIETPVLGGSSSMTQQMPVQTRKKWHIKNAKTRMPASAITSQNSACS